MGMFSGTPWDRPPHCERCEKPEAECVCPPLPKQKSVVPPGKQTLKLSVEKRKKGKLVTVIRGLAGDAEDLDALLGKLKSSCGAGGTRDADALEIQGEQLERVRVLLSGWGYRVK